MAISNTEVRVLTDLELMAHLFRRAGFGATRDELDAALAKGYEATLEELLHPEAAPDFEWDIAYRYYPEMKELRVFECNQGKWLYRMITTKRPLEEKIALFWHAIFATGQAKVDHSPAMHTQIEMLRTYGLGDFRTLLIELSKDPAMIKWLDNNENTKTIHNENYGRELLELFSMGIGNYTEDDVKNCAKAFTGWTVQKTVPGAYPYGRNDWKFEFRADDHDYGEKTFLGETGNFDGADVVDIIVRHPATAQYVARRLFLYFVSDYPDQEAIDELARVYMQSQYDIRSVLRALFMSDAFRSPQAYYHKVKSPAEHVVGTIRLVGETEFLPDRTQDIVMQTRYMGQDLMNPPSVEGWHVGKEWIDTGILVTRINFAAAEVGDVTKPGVRRIIERLRAQGVLSPEALVDQTLELMGPLQMGAKTHEALNDFTRKGGSLDLNVEGEAREAAEQRVTELMQLIVATREFQLG